MSNGILNSLSTSARALNTYSKAVQVAGNNIANLSTPGYARQVVVTGPRDYYDAGDSVRSTGVDVIRVQQIRDQVLDRQIISELKTNGSLTAQKSVFDLLESTIGDAIGRSSASLNTLDGSPEDNLGGSGLSKGMEDFFGAWHELAATPQLATTKGVVFQSAEVLVEQFHVLDRRLGELDAEIIERVQADATQVERLVDQIGALNDSIARLEVREAGIAVELRSERQQRLEELARYIDLEVRESTGNAAMIDLFATSATSGGDIQILAGSQRFTDLKYDGTGLRAGTPPVQVDLTNGSIQGYHRARTTEVAQMRSGLDNLAREIVSRVNAAYNPGGVAGEDFFDPTGLTAGTIQLRQADPLAGTPALSATNLRAVDVPDVAAGGNAIAKAVAALSSQTYVAGVAGALIDGTFTGFTVNLGIRTGQYVESAANRLDAQDTVQKHLLEQRDTLSGVSLDEEVANMLKFQRSYQAVSRVISTLDEMLEQLVTQLG